MDRWWFASVQWTRLAMITRVERPVSDELVRFKRNEQMVRLRRFARKLLASNAVPRDADACE